MKSRRIDISDDTFPAKEISRRVLLPANYMKNKLAILISSPQSYRDIFDINADLFAKNWKDCIFEKIYATDFLSDEINEYKGFQVYRLPECSDWVSRTRTALNKIDTEYVFIVGDDTFLVKHISSNEIQSLVDFMSENNLLYCQFDFKPAKKTKKTKLNSRIYEILYKHPYGRSLHVSIWKKEYLLEILSTSLNAWQIEQHWISETIKFGNEKIPGHIYYLNKYFFHSVYKGKYVRNTKKVLLKNGYHDFKPIRPLLKRREQMKIELKRFGRKITPYKLAHLMKKIFKPFIKFDTDY